MKSKNELEKRQPYQLPHIQQTQSTLYKKQLFESNEVLSSNYTEININCCLRATKACKAFWSWMVHWTPCFTSFWVVKKATWILLDASTLVSHRTVQCGGENCPLMDLSKVNLRLNIAVIRGRVERTFQKRAGHSISNSFVKKQSLLRRSSALCGSHFKWRVVMAYLSLLESIGWVALPFFVRMFLFQSCTAKYR